jgi:hypothetical protein
VTGDFEILRWLDAIQKADAWRDPTKHETESAKKARKADSPKSPKKLKKVRGSKKQKKISNLEPLVELLRSGAPMPQGAQELLADLLSRHSLKLKTTRTPAYTKSESEIDSLVLMEFVDEFKRQPRWHRGPITRAEMDEAVKVLQQRAKAKGDGRREFDGRAAAIKLREERLQAFANYYNLDERFERALTGKDGSVNRQKARLA